MERTNVCFDVNLVAQKLLGRCTGLCVALLLLAGVSAPASERPYTVKRNDTLSGIALQFGVPMQDIIQRNGLKSPDRLTVGQRLIIPSKAPSHIEYTITRGDSLDSIARQFGVPISRLASYNQIQNPNRIVAGQKLLVPTSAAAGFSWSSLDAATKRSLDQANVTAGRWKRIVIHHSGSAVDTPKSMDEYHRRGRRMENGLAYHFVIGNGVRTRDGEIYIGERWTRQLDGGHLATLALNRESIGICMVGNFSRTTPTAKQMESLHALVNHLMDRTKIDAEQVQTHRQVNPRPTECPGTRFPTRRFQADLKR